MKNKIIITFFLIFIACGALTGTVAGTLFSDVPYSSEINSFKENEELADKDFNIYFSMSDDLKTLFRVDKKGADKYIFEKYSISAERYFFIGQKISYVYTILFESDVDEKSKDALYSLMDTGIKPTDKELALFNQYKDKVRNARNLLQLGMEKK